MQGRRKGLNNLMIQAELEAEDNGGSFKTGCVKGEDMWEASSVYRAFPSRGVR